MTTREDFLIPRPAADGISTIPSVVVKNCPLIEKFCNAAIFGPWYFYIPKKQKLISKRQKLISESPKTRFLGISVECSWLDLRPKKKPVIVQKIALIVGGRRLECKPE